MKVRIKFSKHGPVKYIGHLDILRYFQKSMRRAEVDIAYSTGFSPHQIMSFAQPLGVGMESDGDYLDIELKTHNGAKDLIDRLNSVMVPGMRIENAVELPDGVKNAMASIAAASYTVTLKNGQDYPEEVVSKWDEFIASKSIIITKETKKNTLEVDLKPHIYEASLKNDIFECLVDASSAGNIKSTQILEALYNYAGIEFNKIDFQVTRIDTFTNEGTEEKPKLIPLDAMGVTF
ncbi:MAG: TIGR03936 family radical SAM-associated protein [Lachnospiraceae bacterium]|nr:TIGR03936 family radical SAM-associated protein [Candidatus Colinaster scatohippi]